MKIYSTLSILCFAIAAVFFTAAAFAGIPEVVAAQAAVDAAKDQLKAAKKGLTKREKAELAVILATAKLAKIDDKD